jgi:plastocyanin
MKFIPGEITVRKGDVIVWTNKDVVVHDITDENKKWRSQPVQIGKSWKMTVKESSAYFCSIHPMMKGKIIVLK